MDVKKGDQKRDIITVILDHEPEIRDPYLIAAWAGMGNVALGAAKYMKDQLGAERFGEIKIAESFGFMGVTVKDDGTVESPLLKMMPSNTFYYWKNKHSSNDLIIFMGETQPNGMEYEFAHKLIEVGEKFKVKRIYTAAAFALPIHISQESKVHCVATTIELIEDLKRFDLKLMTGGSISGLNGFLLGIAKEKGIEGVCLLGEMPNYLTHIEYPKASYSVLSMLTQILNIEIDMGELLSISIYQEEELKKYIKEIKEQFRKLQKQETLEERKPKVFH